MNQQVLSFERKKLNEEVMVKALLAALRGRGWVRSKVLETELGLSDRAVRALANASDGHIIGSNEGYALTVEAGEDAVIHSANRIFSQTREMNKRGHRMLSVYYTAHRREAV